MATNKDMTIPIGTKVKVHRGGGSQAGTKGCSRFVLGILVGRKGHEILVRLTQDDPYDTVGWNKAGQIGHWSKSVVTPIGEVPKPYRSYTTLVNGRPIQDYSVCPLPDDRNGMATNLKGGDLYIEDQPSKELWLLLDKDNGNPECGHGYVWLFQSRQAARDHKRKQNAPSKYNAELLGPWRVKDCTSEFLKRKRLGKC